MLNNLINNSNFVRMFPALIILSSIIIRIVGISSHPVPDESFEVNRALDALSGQFDWERTGKGGLYILLIPLYSICEIFTDDYKIFLVLGRIVQVVIGSLTVCFIYNTMKIIYSEWWACFFTIPAIVSIPLIKYSHHVNVQNMMFLFIMVHIYLVFRGLMEKNNKLIGLSFIPLSVAAACQMSAAIIITALLILVSIIYTNISSEIKQKFRKILLKYGFISIIIYVVMTPGIILYAQETISYFLANFGIESGITTVIDTLPDYITKAEINFWVEYIHYAMNFYGKFIFYLTVVSIFVLFITKRWILLYPLFIMVLFYLIFSNASQYVYGGRYIIPGLLMGYIILPLGIVEFQNLLSKKKLKIYNIIQSFFILFIFLNISRSVFYSFRYIHQFTLPDSRDKTTEWLSNNLSSTDKILLQDTVNYPTVESNQAVYLKHLNSYPPLDSISSQFIVINKSSYEYYQSKGSTTTYQTFFKELNKSTKWEKVYSITPKNILFTGPELNIYRRLVY